jgi:flagellar hook-associated protein 2
MAGTISIGGLATGLETDKIIEQLLKLERRPVALLEADASALRGTQAAFSTVGGKLAALRTAAEGLRTAGGVLARVATTSDEAVLTAAAGTGAARGTVTLTVTQLARPSTAVGAVGVASAATTVAAGAGSFQFQVGAGDVQTVAVDASTTLADLAAELNALDAGVLASAVNLGTETAPDWRLHLTSERTGAASTITIVRDDTQLTVQTTLAGQDAAFTVSGIATPFARESNTFSDVLGGVTIALRAEGTATVTVDDDPDAVVTRVQGLVTAFNDLAQFVAAHTGIARDGEEIAVGALATDGAARRLVGRLSEIVSAPIAGATTQFVNLSSIGVATQRDGSLALDEAKLRGALAEDAEGVAAVLAGVAGGGGVADEVEAWIAAATATGGLVDAHEASLAERLEAVEDAIESGERRLERVELELRLRFAALEELVAGLQSQSTFLLNAFGQGGSR